MQRLERLRGNDQLSVRSIQVRTFNEVRVAIGPVDMPPVQIDCHMQGSVNGGEWQRFDVGTVGQVGAVKGIRIRIRPVNLSAFGVQRERIWISESGQ